MKGQAPLTRASLHAIEQVVTENRDILDLCESHCVSLDALRAVFAAAAQGIAAPDQRARPLVDDTMRPMPMTHVEIEKLLPPPSRFVPACHEEEPFFVRYDADGVAVLSCSVCGRDIVSLAIA